MISKITESYSFKIFVFGAENEKISTKLRQEKIVLMEDTFRYLLSISII